MPAPYVGEFPVVIGCKLLHTFEIGLHTLFVGEILDIKADESVLDEKGNPDIRKSGLLHTILEIETIMI